jgi:hypothetical protein
MEEALTKSGKAMASRCGVIRTTSVSLLTIILLLRVRYLLNQPERPPLLSEEVQIVGLSSGRGKQQARWLDDEDAIRLLTESRPDANITPAEKRELIEAPLAGWKDLESDLRERIQERAAELQKSHRRVRQAVSLRVRQLSIAPQFPPDLLGILILQPVIKR